jgi:hypothetical protein
MSRIPSPAFGGCLSRAATFTVALAVHGTTGFADDLVPKADERQLPHAMRSEMSERPTITVGGPRRPISSGPTTGHFNRPSTPSPDRAAGSSRSARASS